MRKYISIVINFLLVLTLISVAKAQCSGTFSCSSVNDQFICSNSGCSWTAGKGSCSGTPSITNCASAPDQSSCESVACTWADNACSGTIAGCDIAVDLSTCSAIGCSWTETSGSCSGSSECSRVSNEGTCAAVGCSWTVQAPEGQFDCNQLETNEEKDECWFGTAINARNIEFCETMTDETDKENCKTALVEYGRNEDKQIQGVQTEGGVVVGSDSDNDGVLDENDLCPGTPQGTPVDEKGCKVEAPQTVETCLQSVATGEMKDESGRVLGADDCYLYFAFEKKDSSYCSSIQDEGMKANCQETVGGGFRRNFEQRKGDMATECPVRGMPKSVEDCRTLANCRKPNGDSVMNPTEIDQCIQHVAWENDNIDFCNQISDRNIKNDCLRSLGGDFEGKDKERKRHQGPEGGMPVEIPKDILEVGAGQDFINMFCKSIKAGINNQLKSSMQIIINHVKTLNADPDLSEFLNLDASPIENMVAQVTLLVDAVCNAKPETFKEAVTPLKNLLEGEKDSIGTVVDSVFKQMDKQMRTVMKTLQPQMEAEMMAMQEQIRTQMESQIQSRMQEVQQEAQQKVQSGEIQQSEMQSYIENRMQQVQSELESSMREELKPASAIKMEKIGKKLESLMKDMENKMKEREKEEVTFITADVKDRFISMKSFFNKVIEFRLKEAENRKEQLIAEGLDAAVFDAAISGIKTKITEVLAIFDQAASNMNNVNMEDEDESNDIWALEGDGMNSIDEGIKVLTELWDQKQKEVEELLRTQMQKRLTEEFFERLENFKTLYQTKLAEAQAEGLLTTNVEALYAELLEKETKARAAYDAGNYNEALMYLGLIKAKYELMEKEWAELKTEKVVNGFLGKATALQNRLASAKKRAEMFEAKGKINATKLKGLIVRFDELIASAVSKKAAGDMEGALEDLNSAKIKWDEINEEWTTLSKGAEE